MTTDAAVTLAAPTALPAMTATTAGLAVTATATWRRRVTFSFVVRSKCGLATRMLFRCTVGGFARLASARRRCVCTKPWCTFRPPTVARRRAARLVLTAPELGPVPVLALVLALALALALELELVLELVLALVHQVVRELGTAAHCGVHHPW